MPEAEGVNSVVRIAPYEYIHVTNLNTHVTRLILGPKTYVCLQDERLVFGPSQMIAVTRMTYCLIKNPVMKDGSGVPIVDKFGQVKINLGDEEYRFHQDPFALYPGEKLVDTIKDLPVVAANCALRLRAVVEFVGAESVRHVAGEEWLFEGPATYYPRKEVIIVGTEQAQIIEINSALCLRATRDCVDRNGNSRVFGEKWLVRTPGVYLVGAYEVLVETRKAYILTDTVALHVRALEAHVDDFGKKRRYGEEWLVTRADADSHICSVHEEIVHVVEATVLAAYQYCIILDPVDEGGVPQLGKKTLVRGEKSFFLKPGETLENGVQQATILQANEGIILKANQGFHDEVITTHLTTDEEGLKKSSRVFRQPGAQWMIRGPMEYVPPVEVEIVACRSLIPLDRNEGIYVRNTRTGQIRAVIGEAYMLNEEEELWQKKLPNEVVRLLQQAKDPLADRGEQEDSCQTSIEFSLDLTRVVTLPVPHNAAVQIYDYRAKRARVEFGPALVMLGPDEQCTQLCLSGGKPKMPNKIRSLCLLLGPDFCTDIVVVETADHARLSLQLSYNWHFEVPENCSQSEAAKLFSVPDFIGDACKAIASRIRGHVAAVPFDDFHKNSARIVTSSVFGLDENGRVRDRFTFPQNNLHITSIDIQCVEPLDSRARESLEKSVQLAIEIRTNSQEATARHEANRLEQEALGALHRQNILDEAAAESARRDLIDMRVQLAEIESTGKAKAEAQSQAEAAKIIGRSSVESAKLLSEANRIETDGEIERLQKTNETDLKFQSAKNEFTMRFQAEQTEIEVHRFISMVDAVGPETLAAIVSAGGEQASQLLSCIGLESSLVTNGRNPVNLLATAHGLVGQMSRKTVEQAP
ncbi:hypothetical protein AHF37_01570 [Paragonimus kellicotti]|nr:hypothetical protein AHF37_01570 [Paragonimus kellicotti]